MPRRTYLYENKEKVIDLVINKKIGTNHVAERFGCRTSAVANLLRSNGYEFEQATKTWVRAVTTAI